jgi:hypothetical protein
MLVDKAPIITQHTGVQSEILHATAVEQPIMDGSRKKEVCMLCFINFYCMDLILHLQGQVLQ